MPGVPRAQPNINDEGLRSDQNEYFKAICICRFAIAVPVIRPNVPVPSVAPGFEN